MAFGEGGDSVADDVGALPDDPLTMPPPYWRSGGAIFHVLRALRHLVEHLAELVPLNEATDERLVEYLGRDPEPPEDDPEFGEICDELWELEHEIKLEADTAVFMSAIAAEDALNRFCVYNLHRDIAEPLEKLSPPEKLQVASAIVGHPGVKGQHPFAAVQHLTSWRNAFAHGHCVDRPTKSLRHNHLISPAAYPGVPDSVASCVKLVRGYLVLSRYLTSISKNPYTGGSSEEEREIEEQLLVVEQYKFEGSPEVYTVCFEG
jgi:hypothetical protein